MNWINWEPSPLAGDTAPYNVAHVYLDESLEFSFKLERHSGNWLPHRAAVPARQNKIYNIEQK